MSENIEIRLIPSENINSIIPLLLVLNDSIPEKTICKRLNEMVTQGYRCAGVFVDEKLVGICGLWILTKYYVGKHIEPDNMVILPEYRCKKLGTKLMDWVYKYAELQGCVASELNCYLSNEHGLRFWEKQGYTKIAYHFQKSFEP